MTYYEAEMLLRAPPEANLRSGLNGKARIDTGRTTLGRWAWNRALELINPAMRL